MNAERCGNCRFLEPTATVCRRYPPTIAVIDGKEVSFHLVVFTDIGWCGEWQRAPRTEQDDEFDRLWSKALAGDNDAANRLGEEPWRSVGVARGVLV